MVDKKNKDLSEMIWGNIYISNVKAQHPSLMQWDMVSPWISMKHGFQTGERIKYLI